MSEAAWKFGHRSHILLDGTFGVCSSRVLLFIAMVVDDSRRGLPVAFFLFSVATGTRATHAHYKTDNISKLLRKWKDHLELQRNGEEFCPVVAITDMDTKERGALLEVWPDVYLLLCLFHLRQCWKNHRKRLFSKKTSLWNNDIVQMVVKLEQR